MKKFSDIIYNSVINTVHANINQCGPITKERAKEACIQISSNLTDVIIRLGERDFVEVFKCENTLRLYKIITDLQKQRDDLLQKLKGE